MLDRLLEVHGITKRYRGVVALDSGMFAKPGEGYGETWYSLGGRPGCPMVARPAWIATIFFVAWPALVLFLLLFMRRRVPRRPSTCAVQES